MKNQSTTKRNGKIEIIKKNSFRKGFITAFIIVFAIVGACFLIQYIGWNTITEYFRLSEVNVIVSQPADGEIQVHFIDVGQGDAILIISDVSTVLIDSGDTKYTSRVIDYIRRLEVEQLDLIIATHPHADHIGGLDKVIAQIGADMIITPLIEEKYRPKTAIYNRKHEAIEKYEVEHLYAKSGFIYQLNDSGTAYIEVLGPNTCCDFEKSMNNHSVVVKLTHGVNTFLFTGDIEREAEDCLLDNDIDLSATVLKIAHHGSRTSSRRAFLDAVSDDSKINYAVVSVGSPNRYNHPNDDVLKLLDALEFSVYRTDVHGHIVFVSRPDELEIFYSEAA